MKKNIFKRMVCMLLAMVLVLSCAPMPHAHAHSHAAPNASVLPEYELMTDVLEQKLGSIAGFDPDEEVSFILELEGKALLDSKPESKTMTDHLTDSAVQLQKLEKEQAQVLKALKQADVEVTHTYRVLLNGFAVRAPRSAMADLRAIPGVKNVYESRTYDYVEPVNGYVSAEHTSGDKMDADLANAEGYTGKGTVTAVLDTGLDVDHAAFQADPAGATFTKDDVTAFVGTGKLLAGTDVDSLYKSLKVPFAYDYADNDYVVLGNNDHGTHVAGSVGANCSHLTGVAPDTQLVILKVFSDTQNGAASEWIYAALEDAVILGVDTINMSLGHAGGFSTDSYDDVIYSKVKAAGINLMVSAGNDTDSTYGTNLGVNLPLITEPDNGIVGSPSTLSAAMSVASVNEDAIFQTYLLAGDRHIVFSDTNDGALGFVNALNGQTLEYVWVRGYGVESDFAGVDVQGKIALIPRGGEVAFTTKEENAYNAGAVAMIVYNNEDNAALINMQLNGKLPAAFISKEDGNFLRNELEEKKISISESYMEYLDAAECGLMSDFSSLGVTPDLKLKPEITAPGGWVYSTLPGGKYGVMSGTSMASPHMAGAASVLRQYVNETWPDWTDLEKQSYINTVLMNTAQPVLDEYGVAYTPRKQGAGLANLYNAIHTDGYVTVNGSDRPKADLGYGEDFTKEFTLTVHNTSASELRYTLSALPLTAQQTTAVGNDGNTYDVISNYARVMPESELEVTFSAETVTVPAGGTAEVTVKLHLTDEGKEALADFVNGTFLDGYIQLTAEDGIDLVVPYLGFYGDWGKAEVFDDTIYDEEMASAYPSAMALFSIYSGTGFYLGTNLFAGEDSPLFDVYDADKVAYASRDSYYGRNNYYMLFSILGLLRSPETLTYTITDAEGTQVYQNVVNHEIKSYLTSSGYVNYAMGPSGNGWDPIVEEDDGALWWAPDGDYTLTIDALVAGTDTVHTTAFPFSIDNQLPKVTETRYYVVDETPYLDVSVTDNNYVMSIQLISGDGESALANAEVIGEETKGAVTTYTYDLTEVQAAGYKLGRVAMYDYALNYAESDLFSLVSEFIEADTVTITSQQMTASGTTNPFIIEAIIEPANAKDKTLVWASSNPEVASVEDLGTSRYDSIDGLTYYQALLTPHNVTGDATITATATNGVVGSATIHVTAVGTTPANKPIPEDFVIREDGVYEVGEVNQEVIITDNARNVTLIGSKTKEEPYTGLRFTSQITEGLHLTIENLHISNSVGGITNSRNPICFTGTDNVLTINGSNSFTAPDSANYVYVGRAHISVPKGCVLTINGEGTIDFYMGLGNNAACIGGDAEKANAGTVIVDSGNLNFTIKGKGAGIGGSSSRSIDQVTINGGNLNFDILFGNVTDYSTNADGTGAGIGTGYYVTNYNGSTAPSIAIKGGTITGLAETSSPIIGVASGSNVGATIVITGGKLDLKSTATGDNAGACIGTSKGMQGSATITISGGEIIAETAGSAAAIGSGYRAAAGSITIKGGTITASQVGTAKTVPAIGPGANGTAGSVVITGGSVKAISATTDGIQSSTGVTNDMMEAVSENVYAAPGVTSVSVDGVNWKVSANHPEDENIYLWLTAGEHDVVIEPAPPVHEHSFGAWVETTAPTCIEEGEETRTCECGETEKRPVEALGHDYVGVVTDPTETEQGYTTYTCTRCGDSYVSDYTDPIPAALHKVLHLDNGRKLYSKEFIIALLNEMSAAGYTQLQLAVGNDGMRFVLDDMTITTATKTYASDDVIAAIEVGNKAYHDEGEKNALTQAEMDEIIAHASSVGIEIVAHVNMTAHMNAILDAMVELGISDAHFTGWSTSDRSLNLNNEEAVAFTKELLKLYVNYFSEKGCDYFHIGSDEFGNDAYGGNMGFGMMGSTLYAKYAEVINACAQIVKDAGMTPRAWNDGISYTKYAASFDTDMEITYWSSGWWGYDVAKASDLEANGHGMINTHGDYYYVLGKNDMFTPGDSTEHDPNEYAGCANYELTKFMGSDVQNPIGGMFCIWGDIPDAETETEVGANIRLVLRAMAKRMDGESIDNLDTSVVEGGFNEDGTINISSTPIPEDFVIREDGVYEIGEVNQEVIITDNAREVTLIGAKTKEDPYTGLRFTSQITEGLHLTIENLHITNSASGSGSSTRNPIAFVGAGNTLTLSGTNSFTAPDGVYVGRAHIGVPKGAVLTINGEGSADFYMGIKTTGASIGGDASNANAGTVIVDGGTLNFTIKGKGAGIGGASSRSIDQVTVNGGTLNLHCAYGEFTDWSTTNNLADCGAGIGTGYYVTSYNGSSAPNIVIKGGTINGTTETAAPILGVTQNSDVGVTITINGGKLDLKSTSTSTDAGACIGSSRSVRVAPNITINGGEILAETAGMAAAIGSGPNSPAGNIFIYGGTITAVSTTTAQEVPAIGPGYAGTAGSLWISGGSVKATSASTKGIVTASGVTNDDLDAVTPYTLHAPAVESVSVDGKNFKVSANHPEDEYLYLWLSEGDHEIVSVDDHESSFSDWTVTTEPTCTEAGEESRSCPTCGKAETRPYGEALGHDYVSVVTEPTCTESGYTTHTCSRCGDSYTDSETAPTGHSFGDWTVTTEPTCTEDGEETRTCATCGETETQAVAALGHDYTDVVVEPTCTESGYTTHTCSRCGDSYTDSETAPTGHSFGDWTVTTEPTCTEAGEESRTCECGAVETQTVAALGHTEETIPGKTATCTEDGLTEGKKCSTCGEILVAQEVIPAAGHSFGDWEEKQPATCTEDGYMARVCAVCDFEERQTIPAFGHSYGQWYTVQEPTCTEEGIEERQCAGWMYGCYHKEQRAIPALGHSFGDWVVTTEPGCGTEGVETRTCALCEATETQAIPALECPSDHYVDVPTGNWFHDAVDYVTEKGYMNGMDATHFGPALTMNRAQFVTVLYRMAGEPEAAYDGRFVDVPAGKWYTDAVAWAVKNGITTGATSTTFNPEGKLTRSELVVFMYRYAKVCGYDTSITADLSGYTDAAEVLPFAVDGWKWAVSHGIISGMTADTLAPMEYTNRAQAAVIFQRFDNTFTK